MIGKVRHHRRGSVAIMVVALLTLLAMIASTLVIVSFLDRREARSIAATVPVKNVARSVLGLILLRLTDDLYIDDNGTPSDPSDDVLYGLADTAAKRIDYPSEDVDKHLASPDLYAPAFAWLHHSNVPGDLLSGPGASIRISPGDPSLVDTDGYSYKPGSVSYEGDSLLWDSGMKDAAGRHLMVGTRVIDASGLLHVNLADRPAAAPTDGTVMPITNLSLVQLVGVGIADDIRDDRLDPDPAYSADTIGDYWTNYALRPYNVGPDGENRQYMPFTVADMLAAAWGSGPPDMARGRLRSILAAQFGEARRYLTVASVGRIGVMPMPGRDTTEQKYKLDLNKADFAALYKAFYNLLAGAYTGDDADDRRRITAAQLAVNVIDFRDADSNITREKDPKPQESAIVYGVERQPFIVEAAYKREAAPAPSPPLSYYAIELFNPFETAINIRNWQVKIGAAAPVPMPAIAGDAIPAGERLVIVNGTGIQVDLKKSTKVTINTLDLTQDVLILRPGDVGGNTNYVVVDRISKTDFRDKKFDVDPVAGEKPKIECLRRDDTLPNAFYALPIYNKVKIEDDITLPTTAPGGSDLGKPNPPVTLSIDGVRPCPVYVRNGNFINIADVCRILYVGPGEEACLSEGLSNPTSLYNGRLDMGGSIPPDPPGWGDGIPKLPLGCMPWDFLMVHSPMADEADNEGDGQTDDADTNGGEDLVFGRVNINTAPHRVLECLPGLAGLLKADRDKIVRGILSYRDLMDNHMPQPLVPGSGGGFRYRTSDRPTVLGIDNLRNDPGFASPGEIALPLLARGSKTDIAAAHRLPNATYNSNQAPDNYAVSPLPQDPTTLTDDGLSAEITADLVKHHVYASWLSNHITVRSDVYLAYIAVYASTAEGSGTDPGGSTQTLTDDTKNWVADKWKRDHGKRLRVVLFRDDKLHEIRKITGNTKTTLTVTPVWGSAPRAGDSYQILSVRRRYVALIDRSNVRSVLDRPEVLMFGEVR